MMKPDQDRVRTLLRDTITLLCKNGLSFKNKFSIEAVIGVTLDEDDVFLVSMNEIIQSDKPVQLASEVQNIDSQSHSPGRHHKRARKRKRVKTEAVDESGGEVISSSEDENIPSLNVPDESGSGFGASPNKMHNANHSARGHENNGTDTKSVIHIKEEVDDTVWADNNVAGNSLQETMPGFPAAVNFESPDLSSFLQPATSQLSWISQPDSQHPMIPPTMSRVQRTATVTSDADMSQTLNDSSMNTTFDTHQMDVGNMCQTCGLIFPTSTALSSHRCQQHGHVRGSQNIRYTCKTCGKGFSCRRNLRGHMSWHTGVKEFQCGICSKEFRYEQHLQTHMKTHSDVALCQQL